MMKKTGIALSGGGARGISHLGIIKAIMESGINIDMISGTSAGSIVGALFCEGYTPEEILDIIMSTKFFRFVRPVIKRGLLDIEKVGDIFRKYISVNDFANLKIPLILAATNLRAGKVEYFSKGDLIGPILASCCIPVIFRPYEYKGIAYVDGGISNNLPTEPLVKSCDRIIGSSCNAIDPDFESASVRKIIERSLLLAVCGNTIESRRHCTMFIEPPQLSKISGFELNRGKEIFNIGYEYAIRKLENSGF